MVASRLENVISLTKRRGFVYPCGEIYGGTRAAWDYGPFGVELKENIKRQWWRSVVQGRDDVVGLDSSIILPRQVWVASGHVGVFTSGCVPTSSKRPSNANTDGPRPGWRRSTARTAETTANSRSRATST
jgi:glycyl-tRNA synthetase (class II)